MAQKKPKDERTGEIIQAAVDEFLEKGYDSTSMEAIARRAGVSKGGLYHHFSSKDEILLLANQKLNEPVAAMMLEAAKKPRVSDGLCWYIDNYLQYWRDHEKEMVFYILSFAKLMDNPSLWEMYASYTKDTIAYFQALYQQGIDTGEFIPHSAYDSAVAVMAAVDGIVMYLMMDTSLEIEKIVPAFQERFVINLQKDRDRICGTEER